MTFPGGPEVDPVDVVPLDMLVVAVLPQPGLSSVVDPDPTLVDLPSAVVVTLGIIVVVVDESVGVVVEEESLQFPESVVVGVEGFDGVVVHAG